ncbi:MAG: glycine--tRNA ligase [Candidatus Yanofskybacteria bacterium]|nr:glycine--tRNA ligase [Candidatus Yanofskybacteria bacterium]
MEENLMQKITALAKRRGFVYPGSEIYGGLANSWDYGPLGVELKNNIKQEWWKRFVQQRSDVVGIDAALLMNPKVWEASGHLATFSDPLVECKECQRRFRADEIDESTISQRKPRNDESKEWIIVGAWRCPYCNAENTKNPPRQFNLMLKTFLGPAEESANVVYFRPETAQAMFVNFKNILATSRLRVPFGIAQIGKAFRNEITPGNFIFRTREFEQMELEYFVQEREWEKWFDYWLGEMKEWLYKDLGISESSVEFVEIPEKDRAHYSQRTIDIEYKYPFGQKELYGLAYRSDFDLKNHFQEPPYKDPETGEASYPHVIEPTWGVDRSVLAVLLDSYAQEGDRVILKLKPKLAPYKAAVFPLVANKPELTKKAREVHDMLQPRCMVAWDDRGNIGKRYYAQDEIGTPFCVTVDFETLEKNDVTVRDRDTAKQERVSLPDLPAFLMNKIYG